MLVGMSRTEINNKNLFKLTKMHELEMYIRKARLRWAGHVRRMEDARIPKKLMFGDLPKGKTKSRGRKKKNWFDCLREDLEKVGIVYSQWTQIALDRPLWLRSISSLTPAKEK